MNNVKTDLAPINEPNQSYNRQSRQTFAVLNII